MVITSGSRNWFVMHFRVGPQTLRSCSQQTSRGLVSQENGFCAVRSFKETGAKRKQVFLMEAVF